MTGSRSLTFSTTRRPARRRWVRVAVALLVMAVVAAVVIAVSGGLLWAYAWSQLGGDQLPSLAATGEDAPGSGDATAPTGTTTVLVALTQMPADATDVPPLAGPVALVQVGGPRQDEATVVLLPPELPVSVEGAAPMPLRDVHAAGGADVLLRSVVDYTGVAVDHVVVADRGVLPELVATTGPVEVCRPTCTIVDRASVDASVEAFTAEGTAPVEAADAMVELSGVVRALGAATDPFSAISSPLATRRAIDVIGSRVTTDANLRGAALLPLAEHIGGAGEVSVVTLPGVVNPDTGELLILPEQAETRFALLREGGAPTPSSADDEAALLAQATVSVQNGTGTAGYAASLETRLTALGVRVVGTENATDFDHDTTKVVHAAGDPTAEATAILLARELGDVELVASEEVPSFEGEPVTLQVIGGTDLDDGTDDGGVLTVLEGGDPGPWGPTQAGGVRHRLVRRVLAVLAVTSLAGIAATGTTGYLLYREAEANLTRVPVESLEEAEVGSQARHFLLVGSDDRSGLTAEEQRELTLGSDEEFGGQRSDTMMYVRVSSDRSQVSIISIPRDLIVRTDDGGQGKVTDQFAGGPERVVEALGRTYGLPVNHFAQISLGGFIDVVETLGGVQIELEEPLVDVKSGAEFTESGVYEMDPVEALSFVRSRIGSDYARIDRQQTFIRAVLGELTSAGNLANPARLARLVEDVSTHLTTDEGLGIQEMRFLATDLREAVASGVPMTTFPSYSVELPPSPGLPGGFYVLPYEPGARALREAIASGEALPETATRDEAAEVGVAMIPGDNGRAAGNVLGPTLVYANYDVRTWSAAPEDLEVTATTVVYSRTGHLEEAGWVGGFLGAEVRPLPTDVEVPEGIDVVVAVGADAGGSERGSATSSDGP